MTSRQKKPLVAVVDDDAMVRRALAHLLWARGIDAETFQSGYEFLDAIGRTPALEVDCVVIDIHMPRMDGFEVQRRLRLIRPDLPAIFLSGRHGRLAREAAMLAGDLAYFEKPLQDQMSDFVRALEAILRTTKREED